MFLLATEITEVVRPAQQPSSHVVMKMQTPSELLRRMQSHLTVAPAIRDLWVQARREKQHIEDAHNNRFLYQIKGGIREALWNATSPEEAALCMQDFKGWLHLNDLEMMYEESRREKFAAVIPFFIAIKKEYYEDLLKAVHDPLNRSIPKQMRSIETGFIESIDKMEGLADEQKDDIVKAYLSYVSEGTLEERDNQRFEHEVPGDPIATAIITTGEYPKYWFDGGVDTMFKPSIIPTQFSVRHKSGESNFIFKSAGPMQLELDEQCGYLKESYKAIYPMKLTKCVFGQRNPETYDFDDSAKVVVRNSDKALNLYKIYLNILVRQRKWESFPADLFLVKTEEPTIGSYYYDGYHVRGFDEKRDGAGNNYVLDHLN